MEQTDTLILDMVKAQSAVVYEADLKGLASHSRWQVRKMVAENHRTPVVVLEKMLKDRSKRVAEAAENALKNRI